MNPFEFVIAVLILVFAFTIVRHKMGIPSRMERHAMSDRNDAENERLRGQVDRLQDRIRVLERIVTDSGVQTAAQIEALREKDRIAEDEANG